MNASLFWQEEIRCFPHGCRFSSLWIFRRDRVDAAAPLRLLFHWSRGTPGNGPGVSSPPLGAVLRSLGQDREALSFPGPEAALWVEPIRIDGKPLGASALLFEAGERWREGVFLWGQRLAGRLAPVLAQMDPYPGIETEDPSSRQLDLFPAPGVALSGGRPPGNRTRPRRSREEIPLPRPLMIPGIPGAVGVSQEMKNLGLILEDVACSGANIMLRGESGTGKEVIAVALHASSPRNRGAFVGQNCAALPETLISNYEVPVN